MKDRGKKDPRNYIHLYLGCEVQTPTRKYPAEGGKSVKAVGRLMDIDLVIFQAGVHFPDKDELDLVGYPIDEVKPTLRPLPDMKEDEMADIWSLVGGTPHLFNKEYFLEWLTKGETETGWEEGMVLGALEIGLITQYLLSKSFDVFYLIEAGLAIDKTTLKQNT